MSVQAGAAGANVPRTQDGLLGQSPGPGGGYEDLEIRNFGLFATFRKILISREMKN